MRSARCVWLGRRSYQPVHDLQHALQARRMAGESADVVLLCEHEPVITLGRSAAAEHVLLGEAELAGRRVEVARTGRGGDVTYHGPGQLVVYPILDLRPDRCDVRRYVRALAEVMILIAREHGVEAGCAEGMIGVWADAARPAEWAGPAWAERMVKIGAIGVRISRWVTMHGLALNLTTDLSAFDMIVPCGIRDRGVGSIASLTGTAPAVVDVALSAAPILSRALGWQIDRVDDRSAQEEVSLLSD